VPIKAPDTAMTEQEAELVRAVAKIYGITEEAAHDCLAKGALARRVKKRTGKSPAKVYSIRKKS
jgi:phosphoserine phosphatase